MIHNARVMHAVTEIVYNALSISLIEHEIMVGTYAAGRAINDDSAVFLESMFGKSAQDPY